MQYQQTLQGDYYTFFFAYIDLKRNIKCSWHSVPASITAARVVVGRLNIINIIIVKVKSII